MSRVLSLVVLVAVVAIGGIASAQDLRLSKRAARDRASTGDIVEYSVTVRNPTTDDFTAANRRAVYVVDTPDRGFVIDRKKVAAIVEPEVGAPRRIGGEIVSLPAGATSRIVRFGPFDIPAGGTLKLTYNATVGLDTASGRYNNRAIATDRGGAVLSNEDKATVVVKYDSEFERSTIVGRVFCDNDGDGIYGAGDRGLFGARVFMDAGSYAQTDSAGMYHFSNVPTGTRLVKLDADSVQGTLASPASVLLRLTEAMPGYARFAVRCETRLVDGDNAQWHYVTTGGTTTLGPVASEPETDVTSRLEIRGSVEGSLSLEAGGEIISLPSAEVRVALSAHLAIAGAVKEGAQTGALLPPPSSAGYPGPVKFELSSAGGGVALWRLLIQLIGPGGKATTVQSFKGTGALPSEVEWNGLDQGGAPVPVGSYAVRLEVSDESGSHAAASPARRFSVVARTGGGQSRVEWPAEGLFSGDRTVVATRDLQSRLATLAKTVRPGGTITVESHWDGTGDALATIARTQKEAKLIVKLLAAEGIPESNVKARGRGSLEPLAPAVSAAAKAKNRRLVIVAETLGKAAAPDPLMLVTPPTVTVNGESVSIGADGRFTTAIAHSRGSAVVVSLRGRDGRRATATLADEPAPVQPSASVGPAMVDGDFATGEIRIAGEKIVSLAGVSVSLAGQTDAVPTIRIAANGLPAAPVDFAIELGTDGVFAWDLKIEQASGELVHRAVGGGDQVKYRWSGDSKNPLKVHTLYRYSATIAYESGITVTTPLGHFYTDSVRGGLDRSMSGSLFSARGAPSARLKNVLSGFVAATRRRPASESYVVEIRLDSADSSTVVDRTTAYLGRLGLDKARFHIAIAASRGKGEELRVRPVHAISAPPAARVTVDGKPVAIHGSQFRAGSGGGGVVRVDLVDPRGRSASVVREVKAQPAAKASRKVKVTYQERRPDPSQHRPDVRVHLPEAGAAVSRQLAVSGVADADKIEVNGKAVRIGEGGRFNAALDLPSGHSVIVIKATKGTHVGFLTWPVVVRKRSLFVLGLAEGIMSSAYNGEGWTGDGAELPGMGSETTIPAGPLLLHGRVALYLKAELNDRSGVFKKVGLTAHIDSARDRATAGLFEQLVDPVRDAPIYGDSSTEVRDVNTRGKFYVRLEADDSRLVLGSNRTTIRGGDLFRYDRTIDGFDLDLKRDFGRHRAEVKAFATELNREQRLDINWYRATGGTLYYLRHKFAVEGSEQVRIVVRDRTSGLVVEEKHLVRNSDYTIDYATGRVLFVEAISSVASSGWLINNPQSSATPLDGNPVFIEVRYEHREPGAADRTAGGVYARGTAFSALSVGGGYLTQERDGESDYELWGVDAEARLGRNSRLRAELAGSSSLDGTNMMSADGGLSFLKLNTNAVVNNNEVDETQLGWKVSADVQFRDFIAKSKLLAGTSVQAYVQDLDRGFSATGSALEQAHTKFGAVLNQKIGEHDVVALRHQGDIAEYGRVGPTRAEVDAQGSQVVIDEWATFLTSLQWRGQRGRWVHRVEGSHQRLTTAATLVDGSATVDSNRFGIAAATSRSIGEQLTVRGGQQLMFASGGADPLLDPVSPFNSSMRESDSVAGLISNLGADWRLSDDVTLSGDYFQRWNGDLAAQLGLSTSLADGGSVYIKERVSGVDGRAGTTTVIGASDRIPGTNGRTYGEYQVDNGVLGARNRALLGLASRWRLLPGMGVGAGFEHQQTFGGYLPDGTPIGDNQRNVLYGTLQYIRNRIKGVGRVEVRFEHGPEDGEVDRSLITEDPRPFVPAGSYPDHGGTAVGSPLILPPGRRIQVVTALGADGRINDDHTLFFRVRLSNTLSSDDTTFGSDALFSTAHYVENTLGWVARPLANDTVQFISRYSYLLNMSPQDNGSEDRAHVVSGLLAVNLPWDLLYTSKLAFKWSRRDSMVIAETLDTKSMAILAANRLGYRFYKQFDVSGEYRHLFLNKSRGTELKTGALLELGYTLAGRIRLGAGYNFSRFSDDELRDLERDGHGLFIRITGQY